MAYRRGIIYEWEDSVEELQEEAMPGQGVFTLERMKKRRVVDGKVTYQVMKTIMITFKGSILPTRLLIGQGHIDIKIEPYVEPVKQCYKCLKFGHYQAACREEDNRCAIYGDKYHRACDKKLKCVNCGGDHGSLARMCWVWQREAAIRKVIASKNVEFETARGIVARSAGERETDIVGGVEEVAGSSGDFPALIVKEKREFWEKKEVPIQRELELMRRLRYGNGRENERFRGQRGQGASFSEVARRGLNEQEGEGGKERRGNEEEGSGGEAQAGEKDGEGDWRLVKRGEKPPPPCFKEKIDKVLSKNRYLCLECKEKTEKAKKEGEGGIQILKRIPLPHLLAGEEPEGECEYEKLNFALNKNEMEKERRRIRREKEMNREWLAELEKRKEDEILEEVIKMLNEKNLGGKFHEIIRTRKYRAKRTVMFDPNEDWDAVTTPPFEMYVDSRTREKMERKAEKEREKLREKREIEEKVERMREEDIERRNRIRERRREEEQERERERRRVEEGADNGRKEEDEER
ncbi:uncharacterized protein LOC105664168 [Megachile rotundata]|uniref:uncharacterized protein LOC105664168 n=1 Tax=Megachile rotundata TaxID=143995 RepID=UPI003FD19834